MGRRAGAADAHSKKGADADGGDYRAAGGEIAPLLGLETPLEVWGLHGAERLLPDGRRELERVPAATRARLDEVRALLREDSLGGLFEDKANGAVMHWRGVAARKAREIERRTRELFLPVAAMEGVALLEFEAGLELRTGRDKGGAVEAILGEAGECGAVAFLGDDVTDEAAFRAVNAAEGAHLSVLVRREWRETEADVWLRPPGELGGVFGALGAAMKIRSELCSDVEDGKLVAD